MVSSRLMAEASSVRNTHGCSPGFPPNWVKCSPAANLSSFSAASLQQVLLTRTSRLLAYRVDVRATGQIECS